MASAGTRRATEIRDYRGHLKARAIKAPAEDRRAATIRNTRGGDFKADEIKPERVKALEGDRPRVDKMKETGMSGAELKPVEAKALEELLRAEKIRVSVAGRRPVEARALAEMIKMREETLRTLEVKASEAGLRLPEIKVPEKADQIRVAGIKMSEEILSPEAGL